MPHENNTPGARSGARGWTDKDGNLWLFGGFVIDSGNGYLLNDLWKFDGGKWTWVSGSDKYNQPGVYGTKGVPHEDNTPGAKRNAVDWTDKDGNIWLFGGSTTFNPLESLNDLWKFDGEKWTWVSGSNEIGHLGVYGTKGVSHENNTPGARTNAVGWTDKNGNLWLFGGEGRDDEGFGFFNDLWKFDGEKWTWVSGSDKINQPGVYGTKGVSHENNTPGARTAAIDWTDKDGNLWLFGGVVINDEGFGNLNDLWKFDGEKWTWVSGSNKADQPGVYGTKGVPHEDNTPGARGGIVVWTDKDDNLWLFGGSTTFTVDELLNDLWKFDGEKWTWVSGSDEINQPGVYGTKGVPHEDNTPGARGGDRGWTDKDGNLWLFGGFVIDNGDGYLLNDLWKFDGEKWTWVSGSDKINQPGVYGTKGVPAHTNTPGARNVAVVWTDKNGNLWLFGGSVIDDEDVGYFNDLWKFEPN